MGDLAMRTRFNTILFVIFFLCGYESYSAQLEGVTMPDKIKVDRSSLVLNGMGVRTVTFLNLKVYVAGLYLEQKTENPEKIINSKQVKHLLLYFTRDVDADKLKSVWNESFKKNCLSQCQELKPILSELNSQMTDTQKGDQISFTFFPDSLEISAKGRKSNKIKNGDFSRVILSIWLGKEPPSEDLKNGLLGRANK